MSVVTGGNVGANAEILRIGCHDGAPDAPRLRLTSMPYSNDLPRTLPAGSGT
jgi:hypothetical protein